MVSLVKIDLGKVDALVSGEAIVIGDGEFKYVVARDCKLLKMYRVIDEY